MSHTQHAGSPGMTLAVMRGNPTLTAADAEGRGSAGEEAKGEGKLTSCRHTRIGLVFKHSKDTTHIECHDAAVSSKQVAPLVQELQAEFNNAYELHQEDKMP